MISNDSRITSLQQPKVSSDGNDLLLELLIARHLLPLLLQIICTNLNDGSKYFNLFLQDLETEIPIQNVIQAGVYERREGMFECSNYVDISTVHSIEFPSTTRMYCTMSSQNKR